MPAKPAQSEPSLGVTEFEALVEATRAIAEVLDVEAVLQLIVESVRDLVGAEYAALGIVDPSGRIERFVTVGVSPEERVRIGAPPRGQGVLGLIIRERRPYRIPDIGSHPDFYGFPPNHPAMGSFLGVPVVTQGRSIGNLYLTNKRDAPEFSESDQLLVEMFALRAGIAIENARLHEQVQRLAIVVERERIAKDLHDGIIQAIYGVALSLEDVPLMMASEPEEASARVDRAIDSLNLTIREIRNFILGLRSELLHGADLLAGLATLANEFGTTGTSEIELDLAIDPEIASSIPTGHRVQLLQMTREALSNAARHARARRTRIVMRVEDGMVVLRVEDNGIGFDAKAARSAGHLGLANLHDRAAAFGGTVSIESTLGAGTTLSIRVPLSSAELAS
ncbi:MAG: GAF domain-containing protein [Candidatus Limnocylindrales bacterium]|nr:GAF domain-containing protein [Candidatus Limnocylindrales bacterium]